MGNPQLHDSSTPPRISVNVALCGSVPRSLMLRGSASSCGIQALSSLHNGGYALKSQCEDGLAKCSRSQLQLENTNASMRPVLSERQPLSQLFEAPAWAVPAKGVTRLEPVCEGRQSAIDLTQKSLYRVGRSPQCDVQLLHNTSSRRHAMLFHHANGACYLVDCGSAHGTYVNGVKISPPNNGGVVVPYKVRRGAMIRFGGPGAPCFVLKSFSFKLDEVTTGSDDENEPDTGELVRRNTRLNALGSSFAARAHSSTLSLNDLLVQRKRSFDSLATSATLDEDLEEPCSKRARCSSPPLSPETSPLRLVSPDNNKRHVRFSADPPQCFYPALVTPEDSLSAEEDNDEACLS
mmetsp:Transcript_19057/g.41021  ORF Transcript_19057/g.41021 Transcript_19057/m.41021 type:complete len:350 (+) Transcript_19057:380-1429(+)